MRSGRIERVSDLMITEISDILLRKVKDPRIRYVTVSDVDLTKDLKTATVYYSVLMQHLDREEIQAGLNRAAGFIRGELFHRLRLKVVPTLVFRIDPSIEYGAHIEELLHQIQEGEDEADEEKTTH